MKIKSDKRLEQIFEATLALTGKVGISGLKMSGIAQEAKIASGTLYIYFKSKKELLNALYFKLQEESAPAIINKINHLPIHLQLYKMWKMALKSLLRNNQRIIFLDQFLISPYISEANKQIDTAFKDHLNEILNKGKHQGLIKDADNTMLISLIIGFIRTYSTYLVNNEHKLTEQLIDDSFSLCWEAISK